MIEQSPELLVYAFRFFLGFIFIAAGVAKLTQVDEFKRAIINYRLVPRRFSRPIALWLPRLELFAGFFLAFGIAIVPVACAVAGLLLVFSGAVGINLLRGREMSCNCFGVSTPEKMTWLTVARNLALMGLAASIIVAPPAALSVWAGPGTTSTSVGAGSVIAMLVVSGSVVLILGLIKQAWQIAKSVRELERRFSETSEGESA